jgi:uncharacterized protein
MYKISMLLILLFFLVTSAFAHEIELPNITVYGTSTIKITPDKMIWTLNIQNEGAELKAVAKNHTEIVQSVLSFLKGSSINKDDIQTAMMEFGENWEYKSKSRVKEGYFASTNISFSNLELEKYNKLWIGLSEISGVSVQGVYYDHTKRIEFQNECRIKAILEAKKKAKALAESVGSEIGEPILILEDLSVNEGWQRNVTSNLVQNSGDGDRPDETLSPGTIPIRMRVKVSFRLITHSK